MSSKRPVHENSLGGIKGAIGENQTANGVRRSVTFGRFDKEDVPWKD